MKRKFTTWGVLKKNEINFETLMNAFIIFTVVMVSWISHVKFNRLHASTYVFYCVSHLPVWNDKSGKCFWRILCAAIYYQTSRFPRWARHWEQQLAHWGRSSHPRPTVPGFDSGPCSGFSLLAHAWPGKQPARARGAGSLPPTRGPKKEFLASLALGPTPAVRGLEGLTSRQDFPLALSAFHINKTSLKNMLNIWHKIIYAVDKNPR